MSVSEKVRAHLCNILDVPSVGAEDRFEDFADWDSLSMLSMIAALDADFGLHLTAADLAKLPTVGDLEARVVACVARP